ncbi:HdaA/DnaA family protein [Sphingomonas sp. ID0503]|uniref:HdaA/DnaA family protein n=1 Tax=Sphingomonas sp. ID0503 TaxID=3399691 RepID=UPI003AFAC62B
MSQIALPLAYPADVSDEDFILSPANQAAIHHLDHWSLWPVMATILTGPRKSGRSLLARLFAKKARAAIIDDAETKDEEAIFHAWNAAQAARRPLLIVADDRPPAWTIGLKDLASRLAATPSVAIGAPDDALMQALLEKAFLHRGIAVPADLPRWIAPRVERSYVSIHRIVDLLDQAMLAERRRLTGPLARRVLEPLVRSGE